MAKTTMRDEWLIAQSKLKEAIGAAGIETELEELNQRNSFIISAEQHREEERQIIFAVPDLALRRRVIFCIRECHRLCVATGQEDLRELYERLRNGGKRIRRNALWSSISLGVVAVCIGDYVWGNQGALIGAVVSLLVGVDAINQADSAAVADIAQAQEEIRQQNDFLKELSVDGGFSKVEEETGQPAH